MTQREHHAGAREKIQELYSRTEVRKVSCPACNAGIDEHCFGRTRKEFAGQIPKGRRFSNHLERVQAYHTWITKL